MPNDCVRIRLQIDAHNIQASKETLVTIHEAIAHIHGTEDLLRKTIKDITDGLVPIMVDVIQKG